MPSTGLGGENLGTLVGHLDRTVMKARHLPEQLVLFIAFKPANRHLRFSFLLSLLSP